MKLEIVLEQEGDGTYSVHCPALKGCHPQGETREEALKNIQEAKCITNFMKKRGYSVEVIDITKFVEEKRYGSSRE